MDRIAVTGGIRLAGEVRASGSKNTTLALMAASLLARGETCLRNVPRVRDVEVMSELLRSLGARVDWDPDEPRTLRICADGVDNPEAPYDLVRRMRASFLVLGPLVARCGRARVSEPGGCAIGVRPIDQHVASLAALGAKVHLEHGTVEASGGPLRGGCFAFDRVTVNGTQNAMMAAALGAGETVLENAAREPEVMELADFLNRMGAEVRGAGSDRLQIRGVSTLRALTHSIPGDRIEAGTLLAAGMITRGDVLVTGVDSSTLESTLQAFRQAGADISVEPESVRLRMQGPPRPVRVATQPYPGFPTDMQAQLVSVLCFGRGSSVVTETVFENRFMHVPELLRMGADIALEGRSAQVRGVAHLDGAPVMATDLRASACLLLAALAARGRSEVHRVYHIDRGYERIEEKLRSLGADICREG